MKKVFILFFCSNLHDVCNKEVFGVYERGVTAYNEKRRLEETGRYTCAVTETTIIEG